MKRLRSVMQAALMMAGGWALKLAWKLDQDPQPFYRWLQRFGNRYPD